MRKAIPIILILLLAIPSALAIPSDDIVNNISPVGIVVPFSGDTSDIPNNWLLADGSAILISEYSDLCNVLGNTYQTANASHCFLPDTQDIFIRGAGTLGETGGQVNHTFETDPPADTSSLNGTHLHFTDIGNFNTGNNNNPTSVVSDVLGLFINPIFINVAGHTHTHTVNPPNTASTTNGTHLHTFNLDPFNTTITDVLPPYLELNYIIKAKKDNLEFDPVDLECSAFNSPNSLIGCSATSRYLNGTARRDINFDYIIRDSTGSTFDSGSTTKIAELSIFSFTSDSTPQFYYATVYNNTFGWNDTKIIQTQLLGLTTEQNTTLYEILNVGDNLTNTNTTIHEHIDQTEQDILTNTTTEINENQNLIEIIDGVVDSILLFLQNVWGTFSAQTIVGNITANVSEEHRITREYIVSTNNTPEINLTEVLFQLNLTMDKVVSVNDTVLIFRENNTDEHRLTRSNLTESQNIVLNNLTQQFNNINMTVNNLNVTAVVNSTELASTTGDYICAITRGRLCSQNFVDLVDGRGQVRGLFTSRR